MKLFKSLVVQREIKILRFLMHPHIIRQYEVIETPNDIYVVMEYVKSGELFDYIVEKGKLQEDEARHLFQQVWYIYSIYPNILYFIKPYILFDWQHFYLNHIFSDHIWCRVLSSQYDRS